MKSWINRNGCHRHTCSCVCTLHVDRGSASTMNATFETEKINRWMQFTCLSFLVTFCSRDPRPRRLVSGLPTSWACDVHLMGYIYWISISRKTKKTTKTTKTIPCHSCYVTKMESFTFAIFISHKIFAIFNYFIRKVGMDWASHSLWSTWIVNRTSFQIELNVVAIGRRYRTNEWKILREPPSKLIKHNILSNNFFTPARWSPFHYTIYIDTHTNSFTVSPSSNSRSFLLFSLLFAREYYMIISLLLYIFCH